MNPVDAAEGQYGPPGHGGQDALLRQLRPAVGQQGAGGLVGLGLRQIIMGGAVAGNFQGAVAVPVQADIPVVVGGGAVDVQLHRRIQQLPSGPDQAVKAAVGPAEMIGEVLAGDLPAGGSGLHGQRTADRLGGPAAAPGARPWAAGPRPRLRPPPPRAYPSGSAGPSGDRSPQAQASTRGSSAATGAV